MGAKNFIGISTDLMLAPMVAWMRLPLLLAEAHATGAPGKEAGLALAEKVDAAAEGVVAAQLSLARSAAHFWPEILSGKLPSLLSGAAAELSVAAAFKPASRRVRANYRRLSKKH